MNILKKEFTQHDVGHEGIIPEKKFTTILSKYGVNASGVQSIKRKFSSEGSVDYRKFLQYFEKNRSKANLSHSHAKYRKFEQSSGIRRDSKAASTAPIATREPDAYPPRKAKIFLNKQRTTLNKGRRANDSSVEEYQNLYDKREAMTNLLHAMDVNNSGFVTPGQFSAVLKTLGVADQRLIKNIMSSATSNGKVEYDDFISRIQTTPFADSNLNEREEKKTPQTSLKTHITPESYFEHIASNIQQDWKRSVSRAAVGKYAQFYEKFMDSDPMQTGAVDPKSFVKTVRDMRLSDPEIAVEAAKHYTTPQGRIDYKHFMKDIIDAARQNPILNENLVDLDAAPLEEGVRTEKPLLKSNIFDNKLLPREETSISGFRKRRDSASWKTSGGFLSSKDIPEDVVRKREPIHLQKQKDKRDLNKVMDMINDKLLFKHQSITDAYRQFNKTKRGVIEINDLRKGLVDIGVDLTERQFNLLQSSMQRKNGGVIDFAEFARHLAQKDYNPEEVASQEKPLSDDNQSDPVGNPVYDYFKELGLFRKSDKLGSGLSTFQSDIFGLTGMHGDTRKVGLRTSYDHKHSSRSNVFVGTKQHADTIKLRELAQEVDTKKESITTALKGSDRVTAENMRRAIRESGVALSDAEIKEVTSAIFSQGTPDSVSQLQVDDAVHAIRDLKTIKATDTLSKDDTEKPFGKRVMKQSRSESEPMFDAAERHRPSRTLTPEEQFTFNKMSDKLYARGVTSSDLTYQFEVNRDGTISSKKFKRGLENLGIREFSIGVDKLCKFLDKSDDNKINMQEFSNMMGLDWSSTKTDGFQISDNQKDTVQESETISRKRVRKEKNPENDMKEKAAEARFVRTVKETLRNNSRNEAVQLMMKMLDNENYISLDVFRKTLREVDVTVSSGDLRHLLDGADGLTYNNFKTIFAGRERSTRHNFFASNEPDNIFSAKESSNPELIYNTSYVREAQPDHTEVKHLDENMEHEHKTTSAIEDSHKQHEFVKLELRPLTTEATLLTDESLGEDQKGRATKQAHVSSQHEEMSSHSPRPQPLTPTPAAPVEGISTSVGQQESDTKSIHSMNTKPSYDNRMLRQSISDRIQSRDERVALAFRKLDDSRNGTLSVDELRRGLTKMGFNLNSRQFSSVLRDLGVDARGCIHLKNFAEYIDNASAFGNNQDLRTKMSYPNADNCFVEGDPLYEKLYRKVAQRSSEVRDVFRLFDDNKDGQVTEAEFKRGIQKIGIQLDDSEVKRVMRVCDVSGSGVLGFNDFARIFKPMNNLLPKERMSVEQRKQEYVNRRLRNELVDAAQGSKGKIQHTLSTFDLNDSRVLPADTFRQALRALDKHIPQWVVERAVRVAERDREGMCNYDKFLYEIGLPTSRKGVDSVDPQEASSPHPGSLIRRRGIYTPVNSGDIIGHTTPIRERPTSHVKTQVSNAKFDSGDIIGHRDDSKSMDLSLLLPASEISASGQEKGQPGKLRSSHVVDRLNLSPGRRFQHRPQNQRNPLNPSTLPHEQFLKQKARIFAPKTDQKEKHPVVSRRSEAFHQQFNTTNHIFSNTPEDFREKPKRKVKSKNSGDIISFRHQPSTTEIPLTKGRQSESWTSLFGEEKPHSEEKMTAVVEQISTPEPQAASPSPQHTQQRNSKESVTSSSSTVDTLRLQNLKEKVRESLTAKFPTATMAFRALNQDRTNKLSVDDIKDKLYKTSNIDLSKYEVRQIFGKDPKSRDERISFLDFNDIINPKSDKQKRDDDVPHQWGSPSRRKVLSHFVHMTSEERARSAPPKSPKKPKRDKKTVASTEIASRVMSPRRHHTPNSFVFSSQPIRATRYGSPFNPLRTRTPTFL